MSYERDLRKVPADDKTRVDPEAARSQQLAPRQNVLVVVYGANIGRRYPLRPGAFLIGRGESNDIVLEFDNVSRHHAEIMVAEDQSVTLQDKGSTNGTYLNDRAIRRAVVLNSGDLIKIGGHIFKYLAGNDVEGLYFEEIYRMTIIDGLTEVHNKRYLLEFLDREMARCRRYQRPLTLIMFDLDHFKSINDTYGHTAGDFVLKRVAKLCDERVRTEELFARYGGEEFCIVMPESDVERAAVFADKLRALVEAERFVFDNKIIPVTLSLGVGAMDHSHEHPDGFIASVDEALYAAKRLGRNRVETVSSLPVTEPVGD